LSTPRGKSFVDVLDNDLLIAKPVALAATAGSSRHALVVDEQMRSLFAYMRALTLPTSVFAACGRSEVRAHVCRCRSPGNRGVSPDAGSVWCRGDVVDGRSADEDWGLRSELARSLWTLGADVRGPAPHAFDR
jgi:hypothetical protein